MPGVPREMKPMLAEKLIPWLVQRFDLRQAIYTRTLHVVGIGESDLDRRVEDLFRTLENPKIAMLAHGGRVDVKVMAKADSPQAARARRWMSQSWARWKRARRPHKVWRSVPQWECRCNRGRRGSRRGPCRRGDKTR